MWLTDCRRSGILQPLRECCIKQYAGEYEKSKREYGVSECRNTWNGKKASIAAIISAVLLGIAMFLPYVSIDGSFVSVSKALIDGDGVLFLIVAAIGVIGALIKKNGIVIFSGVLACLLSIVEIVVFARNEYREFFTRGAGFYMMIIASASLLISGFIKRK